MRIKGHHFPINQNGHPVITIPGFGRSGKQEVVQLQDYIPISKGVSHMLTEGSYDAQHQLNLGQILKIALIHTCEIPEEERQTENVLRYGEKFGYSRISAGVMPRICEYIPKHLMERMDLDYILGLHRHIKDDKGVQSYISMDRFGPDLCLQPVTDAPCYTGVWIGKGAFVFLES